MLRLLAALLATIAATSGAAYAGEVQSLRASDGASIAFECAGAGPTLLIVHGGTGDRTRWLPMASLLAGHLHVCVMDRRAHGQSTDGPNYSLERESRDVAEIAQHLPGPVTVMGHSFGAVASLDAALMTGAIARLVLYEPPVQAGNHSAAQSEIQRYLDAGEPEAAAEAFLTRLVQISPEELKAMKSRPNWSTLVASMGTVLRQDQALVEHTWTPARYRALRIPVLLLLGERTQSPELRRAISGLQDTLPDATLVVLAGQEHNAIDSGREALASAVLGFLGNR